MTYRPFSLLTCGLSAVISACGAPLPQATPPGSPQLVLLISFDTLRADALGEQPDLPQSLTPNFDAFAQDAVMFERAFAQITHTLPSHMSLWTGVYPDTHGVEHEGKQALPPTFTTLSQVFATAGYKTAAVVTSEWLKPEFGYGHAFDEYEVLGHAATYSERINSAALPHLDELHLHGGSLFLFLHNYEAHCDFTQEGRQKLPYYAPPHVHQALDLEPDGDSYCDDAGRCAAQFLMHSGGRHFSVESLSAIHGLYRAGVRYLDEELGTLIAALKSRELYDEALIIITSDHGEEFREHGRFTHSQPYDETLAIPLLIKFPGGWRGGSRIERLVETVDIFPTLADYLGLEAPPYLQGASLLPLVQDRHEHKAAIFARGTIEASRYAVRTTRHKFIIDFQSARRELYDLERDPSELENIASDRGELVRELETLVLERMRESKSLRAELVGRERGDDESLLSDEERQSLEALGYIQ